jgi:hypothetical protein
MCLSCGCGVPNDDHGDQRNITQQRLDEAAEAAGISATEAADNIKKDAA